MSPLYARNSGSLAKYLSEKKKSFGCRSWKEHFVLNKLLRTPKCFRDNTAEKLRYASQLGCMLSTRITGKRTCDRQNLRASDFCAFEIKTVLALSLLL